MDAMEDRVESLTQKKSQVRVLFRPLVEGLSQKGSPSRCNLKVLCFPRFVLDRTPSTYVPGATESEPRYLRTKRSRGRFLPYNVSFQGV